MDAIKLAAYAKQLLPRSEAVMCCILPRDIVWMHLNIPLMQWQNTDIAWNRVMLWANVTLLHTDVMLLPVLTRT